MRSIFALQDIVNKKRVTKVRIEPLPPTPAHEPSNEGISRNTAETPGTYSFSGFTQGPEVRLAENCENYAFSTRAGGGWGPAIGHSDGFEVSPDGSLITGKTGGNMTTWEWTFSRQ